VDEVFEIMRMNVKKVIETHRKLSELDHRTKAIQEGASQFKQQAGKRKQNNWLKNFKMVILNEDRDLAKPFMLNNKCVGVYTCHENILFGPLISDFTQPLFLLCKFLTHRDRLFFQTQPIPISPQPFPNLRDIRI